MNLFGRQQTPDDERRKRSQEQMALGGLPLDAEDRLRELHGRADFFTSNLSVSEFVLAADDGLRPLGQVMGSTIYHIGWQYTPVYQSGEMTTLSHAQYQARMLALSRLQQEAERLGAHGVIGVRMIGKTQGWGKNLLEFTAIGTAVRWPNAGPPGFPFACALSGQELWALGEAGHIPVGVALGTCVYYQIASPETTQLMQGGLFNGAARVNQEIRDYAQGFYEARLHAMTRMEEDAACHHADGIIGVEIGHTLEEREVEIEVNERKQRRRDCIVTFTALGTAIRSFPSNPWSVQSVMPLNK